MAPMGVTWCGPSPVDAAWRTLRNIVWSAGSDDCGDTMLAPWVDPVTTCLHEWPAADVIVPESCNLTRVRDGTMSNGAAMCMPAVGWDVSLGAWEGNSTACLRTGTCKLIT